jgi:hypothetical protein
LRLGNRWRSEDAETLLGERSQQCRILEFPNNDWANFVDNDPLV